MKKLYEKNETAFAVTWILIYIIGTCLAEALSEIAGIFKLFPAIFHAGLAAFILVWVKRNGLTEKYGLFLPRYRLSQAWFFLPLVLVASYKVVFSPALRYAPVESMLFVVSMLCVGFLEEMIFRGFLFRAMEKKNLARAVVVSAVTFGIGHIVNLINGQDLLETCGQIAFAVIVGFALVILFYKGRSLVPCIVFHSVFNSLSVISNENAQMQALGGPVAATAILVGASAVLLSVYTIWNRKHLKG